MLSCATTPHAAHPEDTQYASTRTPRRSGQKSWRRHRGGARARDIEKSIVRRFGSRASTGSAVARPRNMVRLGAEKKKRRKRAASATAAKIRRRRRCAAAGHYRNDSAITIDGFGSFRPRLY